MVRHCPGVPGGRVGAVRRSCDEAEVWLAAGAAGTGGTALAAIGLIAHGEALAVVAHPLLFGHTAVGAGLLVTGVRVVGLLGNLLVHVGSPLCAHRMWAQSLILVASHGPTVDAV